MGLHRLAWALALLAGPGLGDRAVEFPAGTKGNLSCPGDLRDGCKFLLREKESALTCCYSAAARGASLCDPAVQSPACQAADSFAVEERAGSCVLTVSDWRTADSGNYYVVFPAQLSDNAKIAVAVKGSWWWWPWIALGLGLASLGAAGAAFIKWKKDYTEVKDHDDVEAGNRMTPERKNIKKDFVKDRIDQFEGKKRKVIDSDSDSDSKEQRPPPRKKRKVDDNCFPKASCLSGNDSILGPASPQPETDDKEPKEHQKGLGRGQEAGGLGRGQLCHQIVGPASA